MPSDNVDLAKLNRLAGIAKPGSALRRVLDEAVDASKKVTTWTNVTTSGSAVASYDAKTGHAKEYEIRYQFGDTGNLVHELTHVAVNEAYRQDFVNYPNPTANPPAPDYDDKGRRRNEQLRQAKWMDRNANERMIAELTALTGSAERSGLPRDQVSRITEKLRYGQTNPHIEHDTVINQVLVWMFEWGYPALPAPGSKKSGANTFYEDLEKAATRSYNRRHGG